MKHEYTDEELALALVKAGYSKELHYKEILHILSTLPDQTDEWERCEFSDIRKGDRVRAEFIDITYEGTAVDVRDYKIAIGHNRNEILRAWKNPDIYRIPAPVVHPDPAVHEFILDKETGRRWEANGDIYVPILGRLGGADPRAFIDWTELELTVKEVNTDE